MSHSIDRILVIVVSRIGDTLLTTPAIKSIANHYPNSKITILTHPKRLEVISNLDFVHSYGKISKRSAFLKGWFGKEFDLTFVYSQDSQLLEYAFRVSQKVISYKNKLETINKRLFAPVEPTKEEAKTSVDSMMSLPRFLGIEKTCNRLLFEVTDSEKKFANDLLFSHGIKNKFLVGLQCVSFPTKSFRDWPLESFLELCRKIVDINPDSHFLLYGGSDPIEEKKNEWLKSHLGTSATLLTGLSIRKTAAIMSRTNLYIGVDTGPSHIMSSFDIPMLVLYHCLYKDFNVGTSGHPYLETINLETTECTDKKSMSEISVKRVFDKIKKYLINAKD